MLLESSAFVSLCMLKYANFKIKHGCIIIIILFIFYNIIALPNGPPPIRLVGGYTAHEGRIELYIEVKLYY